MEVKPGFKKTELGVIPIEWKTYLLEEISDRISVGLATSVTKHYRSSGVPIVRNLNIKDGFFDGSDMLFITPEFANANANKAARALDVLTVRTGSNLGQTCVLPLDFDNCQTFTTLITTPKKTIADPYFLCLHMSSEFGRNEMARLQAGGGKGNLNTGELKKYRVGLPNGLPEQRAIAEALSDVDGLLGGLDRLIAKKRDLKQAAMQQLLTGQTRLPGFHGAANTRPNFKETEVGEIPEDWTLDYVEHIAHVTTGSKNTQDNVEDGQYPFFVRSQTVERINSYSFDGEAVLTAGDGVGTGKVFHYINGKFDVHQRVYRMSDFIERVNGYFFYLYFSTHFFNRIMQMTAKSSVDSVRREMIARMPIPLPPTKAEQTAIAAVLTDMDAELAVLEQRQTKTRALKQGMMQELLTGRTRLVDPQGATS